MTKCFMCEDDFSPQTEPCVAVMMKDGPQYAHESCRPTCTKCQRPLAEMGTPNSGAFSRSDSTTIEHIKCPD